MTRWLVHAVVALAWVATALLARIQEHSPHASLWFPPAGLSFAVGLILGWRGLPGIVLAAAVGTASGILGDDPRAWTERLLSGLSFGLAHGLCYVAGARLLLRFGVQRPSPRAVSAFLLVAPATAVVATLAGMATLVAFSGVTVAAAARDIAVPFVLGDSVAVVALGPLFAVLLGGFLDRLRLDPPEALFAHLQVAPPAPGLGGFAGKLALCLLALAGSAALVAAWPAQAQAGSFLVFFGIVPLMWIAHTEGALRTYAAIAALSTAIAGVAAALGPGLHEVSYQFSMMILAASALFGLAVPVLYAENRDLRRRLTHDSLTGAHSRAHFFEVASRELERARRFATPLAVAVFDVDHFKSVNDHHGHAFGDAALRTIAARCQRELRASDALGRLGGEEFALLLPMTDAAAALETAERLADVVRAAPVVQGGESLRVTASFGVAQVDLLAENIAEALARADRALYEAKRAGRDRVLAAPPTASPAA